MGDEALDYYPFGQLRLGGPDSDTTHLFTGHERDLGESRSQLDYMHARYFSANLGRFLSVDPVGGEVGSSQSWNRYSYVRNSPVNLVDPGGEVPVAPAIAAGVAALAFYKAATYTLVGVSAVGAGVLIDHVLTSNTQQSDPIVVAPAAAYQPPVTMDSDMLVSGPVTAPDSVSESRAVSDPDRYKAEDQAGRDRAQKQWEAQQEKEKRRFGPKESTPADRTPAGTLKPDQTGENTDIKHGNSPDDDDVVPPDFS